MTKRHIIPIIIVIIICLTAAYFKVYRTNSTDICATGTIEVTHSDIVPKVSGYLTDFVLNAGDQVKAGTIAATVSRPELEAQLLRDELALNKADVQLTDLQKGCKKSGIS